MIRHLTALAGLGTLLVACTPAQPHPGSAHSHHPPVVEAQEGRHDHPHRVTLAFAGDVHFQIQVAALTYWAHSMDCRTTNSVVRCCHRAGRVSDSSST